MALDPQIPQGDMAISLSFFFIEKTASGRNLVFQRLHFIVVVIVGHNNNIRGRMKNKQNKGY